VNALGKILDSCRQSNLVLCGSGKIAEAIQQSERLQDGSVDADADAMVTLLYPAQCWPRCEGPLSHDFGGQAAPPACIVDVLPQLAQGAANGEGGTVWRRHNGNIAFH
jgi:hypothetical protein